MRLRSLLPTACVFAALLALALPVSGQQTDPAALDRLIHDQQWDEAAETARVLLESDQATSALTLPLARLARAFQQQDDLDQAAEFYQRAVQTLDHESTALEATKAVLVRLAAASVLTQVEQHPAAIQAVTPILDAESAATDDQRAIAVTVLLRVGSSGLSKGDTAVATEAYTLALSHANETQMATAMLGDAWSTAILRDQPLKAADKLHAFLQQYPDHADAARAARARAECLKQADRADQSQQQLDELIRRWPDSDAALEVIRMQRGIAADLVSQAAIEWLMQKANANELDAFDVELTVLAIAIATARQELEAWSNLTAHLASIDESGQATSDVLSSLIDRQQAAEAERLATLLIAPTAELHITPAAREAACRWAGRQQKWSMLALASENENLDTDAETRTESIERLMAEALTQTGQAEQALRWWTFLVDQRKADDFSTLLRCAELETSTGQDAAFAQQRVDAARQAADSDRFRLVLVNLVDAELAIRRSQFDQARARLESVVRESDTAAHLRGRAQWLIGETHYLQQHFAEAIGAYRRVEGIDPGGMWVPASLVQAGKAFEQLGRPREASICYSHLMQRFADSSHAATARRRMAALQPAGDNENSPSQSPIRR